MVNKMNRAKKKKAVVLLSGGMDSSVVAAMAKDQGFDVHAITFDYGQRHNVEVEAAKATVATLGIENHRIVNLDIGSFGGSSLTTDAKILKNRTSKIEEIPSTYVPARNTVFLSIALSYAEATDARDIFIGVSFVDYSGYPDCRPTFIEAFEKVANLGTRAVDGGEQFTIHAPLLKLSKKETVEEGIRLGVDFALTRSCYDPGSNGEPCGACDSCLLRNKGFDAAGIQDPVFVTFAKK